MTYTEIDKSNIQKSWLETISVAKRIMLDICSQYRNSIHRIAYTKEEVCRKFIDADYGLIVIFCNQEDSQIVNNLTPSHKCRGVHWCPSMFDGKNCLIHLATNSFSSEPESFDIADRRVFCTLLHELIHFVDKRHFKLPEGKESGAVGDLDSNHRENVGTLKKYNPCIEFLNDLLTEELSNAPFFGDERVLKSFSSENQCIGDRITFFNLYHNYAPETEFHAITANCVAFDNLFRGRVHILSTFIDILENYPKHIIPTIMFIEASVKDDSDYKLPRFADKYIYSRADHQNKNIKGLTTRELFSFRDKLLDYLETYLDILINCVREEKKDTDFYDNKILHFA